MSRGPQLRPLRRLRRSAFLVAAGAAAAYFFDPDSGQKRVAALLEKVNPKPVTERNTPAAGTGEGAAAPAVSLDDIDADLTAAPPPAVPSPRDSPLDVEPLDQQGT